MTFEVWGQTDVGLRRERNEDTFLFDEACQLYMVADGMGGHRGGEVASKIAVETVREVVAEASKSRGNRQFNPRLLLAEAYEEASRRIYDASQEDHAKLQGMGTTLVAAFCLDGVMYVANVGDSRAYLFSRGALWQMTEDHSLMNEQLRTGILKEQDIPKFTARNVITRSVGFEAHVEVDIIERTIQPGDVILMCSDGLSGLVSDQRIAEICRTSRTSEIVSKCINEAKHRGGDDNVTALVLCARQ